MTIFTRVGINRDRPLTRADIQQMPAQVGEPAKLVLRNANMQKINLSGMNLTKADLSGADLIETNSSGDFFLPVTL